MRSNLKIIHLRRIAAKKQAHRCYYCNRQMGKAAQLSCTAEHLVARADHGKDSKSNIVAACKFCNSMRHRSYGHLTVPEYLQQVRALVSSHRWHEQNQAWRRLA